MLGYKSQAYSKVLLKGFSWDLCFWENEVDINFPNLSLKLKELAT